MKGTLADRVLGQGKAKIMRREVSREHSKLSSKFDDSFNSDQEKHMWAEISTPLLGRRKRNLSPDNEDNDSLNLVHLSK